MPSSRQDLEDRRGALGVRPVVERERHPAGTPSAGCRGAAAACGTCGAIRCRIMMMMIFGDRRRPGSPSSGLAWEVSPPMDAVSSQTPGNGPRRRGVFTRNVLTQRMPDLDHWLAEAIDTRRLPPRERRAARAPVGGEPRGQAERHPPARPDRAVADPGSGGRHLVRRDVPRATVHRARRGRGARAGVGPGRADLDPAARLSAPRPTPRSSASGRPAAPRGCVRELGRGRRRRGAPRSGQRSGSRRSAPRAGSGWRRSARWWARSAT